MGGVKSLAKDTAIYGLSSIIGRFLNWCLVPLYTMKFVAAEYGVVTFVYSVVAMLLLILTYGMETGFFRFANHDRYKDPMEVYSTSLLSLASTSSLFIALVFIFLKPVTGWMQCGDHESYVWMMAIAVAVDAFTAIPFCYLRYRKCPLRFAYLKLIGIGLNILLNLWWILVCPWLWLSGAQGWIAWCYSPTYGIGYIFLANLVSSSLMLLLLWPELRGFKWKFNVSLWREMLIYSWPLLILGIAGIMNQTIDKVIFPWLVHPKSEAMTELGIYGANYKIAIVMVMFIQAFRFAYEPFIFAQNKENSREGKQQAYRDAMKWFVIGCMVIFLGVMSYLDVLRYFISPHYFSGLKVVPLIMVAEFFFGVFFNLSLWYKLSDKTIWGMWFSLLGLAVTLGLNVLLVPYWGYMGCATAAISCYGVMMLSSYFVGRAKTPIHYDMPRIGLYFFVAMGLYGLTVVMTTGHHLLDMAIRTPLLVFYIWLVMFKEKISLTHILHFPHHLLGIKKTDTFPAA